MQILGKEVRHMRMEIVFSDTMGRVKKLNKDKSRTVKQNRDG